LFRARFQDLPEALQEPLGGFWGEFALLLGKRLAELHATLASCRSNPDFTPEPYTLLHQQATYHAIRTPLRRQLARLAQAADTFPAEMLPSALETVEKEGDLLARLKRLIEHRIEVDRIRIHGDLGLDRVLFTGKDFVFTGFDGEPWRPLPERRFKFCALRDVAALLHSFAAYAEQGVGSPFGLRPGDRKLLPWARHWADLSGALVLDSYLEAAQAAGGGFLPRDPADLPLLLDAFRIERASFELKAHLGGRMERIQAAIRVLSMPAPSASVPATPDSPTVPG
jgi:maltose alpha-D-glucosyltransferase/alpha-amylase